MTVISSHLSAAIQPPQVLQGFKQALGIALGATAMTLGIAHTSFAQADSTQPIESAQPVESTQPVENTQIEGTQTETPAAAAQTETGQTETGQTEVIAGTIAAPTAPTPAPAPFSPLITGIIDLSTGTNAIDSVGHLRPADLAAFSDDKVDWLKSAIVPLYNAPGGDHWGWIYEGWMIPKGQPYLAIGRDAGFAMIRAYENLHTFPVLEIREDGWVRVQYTEGGSAWAHTSQLELGETALTVESWEDHLSAQKAVHFLDRSEAQPLRSQPQSANNMLSLIPNDSLIEPKVIQGDWMLVKVTRPVADCTPLTGATTTEGWMRWRGEEGESLVWHRPDASCEQ